MRIFPSINFVLIYLAGVLLTVVIVIAATNVHAIADAESWSKEAQAGDAAAYRGDYREAEGRYRVAIQDAEDAGAPDEKVAGLLESLAYILVERGNTWSAEGQLTRALELRENAQGVGHADFASALVQRAEVRMRRRQYDDAHSDLEYALRIREGDGLVTNDSVVEVLTILVELSRHLGRGRVADALAEVLPGARDGLAPEGATAYGSWSLWLAALEEEDPVSDADELGGVSDGGELERFLYDPKSELGDPDLQIQEEFESQIPQISDLPPETTSRTRPVPRTERTDGGSKWWVYIVPIVLTLLGALRYFAAKDSEKASPEDLIESRVREALKTGERGVAQLNAGQVDGARQQLETAADMLREAGAPDGHERAKFLNILAVIYMQEGRWGDADRALTEALGIYELVLSAGRLPMSDLEPAMSAALTNEAMVKEELCRLDEAEVHLRRLVAVKQLRYSTDDWEAGPAYFFLARNLHGQGKLDESLGNFLRAFSCIEGNYDPEQLRLAHDAALLAMDLRARGDQENADTLLVRAENLCAAIEDSAGPDLARTLHVIGGARAGQRSLEEAEALLARALEIFERTLGRAQPEAAAVISNLGQVRLLRGDAETAEQLQREALEYREGIVTLTGLR